MYYPFLETINTEKIISNLLGYIFKNEEAPSSAETHLSTAIFEVIDSLNEKELESINKYGIEMCYFKIRKRKYPGKI